MDITHWKHGVWNKKYEPGIQNITIDNSDIVEEYEKKKGVIELRKEKKRKRLEKISEMTHKTNGPWDLAYRKYSRMKG